MVSGVKVSSGQEKSLQVGKKHTIKTDRTWQSQKVSKKQ